MYEQAPTPDKVTPKAVDKAGKDEQIALEEWDRYRRAKDMGHEAYMERARKNDDYYRGEQWKPEDKAKLDAEGRPALTINQILPTVNTLVGEQITRRASIRYKPRKNGSEEIAAVLTKVTHQILDTNDFDSLETEVFTDGCIEERGYFDIRVDFDDDLLGNVAIEVEDPKDIIPDPYAKRYDPNTWQEVTRTRWWSLDEIEVDFGKEARDKVEALALNERTQGHDSIRYETSFADDKDGAQNTEWWASDPSKRQVRTVRLLERQFYKNDTCHYFVDPETGDYKKAPPNWNRERRRAFAAQMRLFLHKKVERRVRWRVCADKVLLHDEWSPYRSFTIVPYFAYFRRGKTMSVVTNLLSPQDNLNKLSSQELHIVNSTANSGWTVEEGSLTNMTTEELAAKGATTGLVVAHRAGSNPPEKITANSIPTGLDRIGMKAAANIREISGINKAMLGLESAEVSGVALEAKEKRGQIQAQVPMDNLARTRRLVARKVLELVQDFYTEPRIIKIARELPKPGEPESEDLEVNMRTAEGTVLNDLTVGEYDVMVASQPSRDSYNDTQFAEALSLREVGIQIPDDRIIEFSNLDKKYELAQEIRDLTGRGEVSEEEAAIQQTLQNLELMSVQLNVSKLEAEVMKLRAEAQKIMVEGSAIPQELEIEIMKLEAEIQKEREGFETRLKLARMQGLSALEKVVAGAKAKQLEQVTQAALAPKPTAGKPAK